MAYDVPQGWFEKFSKQMKEQFRIDLTKKEDLMLIVAIDGQASEDSAQQSFFPFMQRKEGKYVNPKPIIAADDFLELQDLFFQELGLSEGDEGYQELHEERMKKATALMEDRSKWQVENQTVIDPKNPEHEAMIKQLYEVAKEGRLMLVDPYDGEALKNKQFYIDDSDNVHSIEAEDIGYYGEEHFVARDMFFHKDKAWHEKHFPGENIEKNISMTKRLPEEPKPVPKPGFGSWFKRIFSFGIARGDFDRYDKYLQDRRQYEIDVEEVTAFNKEVNEALKHRDEIVEKAEEILLEEYDTYKGVGTKDRRVQLLNNGREVSFACNQRSHLDKEEILSQMDEATRAEREPDQNATEMTMGMLNSIANSKSLKMPTTLIFNDISSEFTLKLDQHLDENNMEAAIEDLGVLMANRLMARRFKNRELSAEEMRDKDAIISEGKKVCKDEKFKNLFADKADIEAVLKKAGLDGIDKAIDKNVIVKYNEVIQKSKASLENDAPQKSKVASKDGAEVQKESQSADLSMGGMN